MSGELYFVISNSDGDSHVRWFTKEHLLEALEVGNLGDDGALSLLDIANVGTDTNYWGGRILVIRGTVAKITPPGDWGIE